MGAKPKSPSDWFHSMISDPVGFVEALGHQIFGSKSDIRGEFTVGLSDDTLKPLVEIAEEYMEIRRTEAETKRLEAKAQLIRATAELLRQTTNAEVLERVTGGDPSAVTQRAESFLNCIGSESNGDIVVTEVRVLPSGEDADE